jgi:hypothetical protein
LHYYGLLKQKQGYYGKFNVAFFNKNKLFQSIEMLLKDNARSNMSSDNKDKISRSILFLKNTAGLYYGHPIKNMIDDAKYIFNKYATVFFKGKKNEYYLFLQAFKNFQLGFFDIALNELPQLAYSSSQYLAIWSRLIEIKIHQIQSYFVQIIYSSFQLHIHLILYF